MNAALARQTLSRYDETHHPRSRERIKPVRVIAAALLVSSISACSSLKQTTGEAAPIQTPEPAQKSEAKPTSAKDPLSGPGPIGTKDPVTSQQPVQNPTPKPPELAAACECPKTALPGIIIGEVEYALVGSKGLLKKARIDTGATTSSIGIASLTPFERDGDKWLRFTVNDRLEGGFQTFERPLIRLVDIKRHDAEANRRPVVNLKITIGNLARDVEVTLANRDAFEFPLLIGRNFLEGKVLVDVSQRYIATVAPES
ncbi:MAG: RimK/LysX family protein [Halioglobus sp.]